MFMKKTIPLTLSSEYQLFRAYVELLQPLLKIRDREADVYSQLLYFNFQKQSIVNLTDRFELIFSAKSKKQICENLGINDNILQNTLSILRKKKLIVNNSIPTKFHLYPIDMNLELTFKLTIKVNE